MTRLLRVAMVSASILGMTPYAHADAVLVTAPLARGGVPFTCFIANAGAKDVDVTIEYLSGSGTGGSFTTSIVPGGSFGYGIVANAGGSALHCRFTVSGSKNKVRALACAYSSIDTSGPCLSTSEAR